MSTLSPGPAGYLTSTRVLSAVLVLVGLISTITGALLIYYVQYAGDLAKWPTMSGSGMWVGVVAIVCGSFGIATSCSEYDVPSTAYICNMKFHTGGAFATVILSGFNLSYSITIFNDWTRDLQEWYCNGHYPQVIAMTSINLALSIVLALIAVILIIISFCGLHRRGCGAAGSTTNCGVQNMCYSNNGVTMAPATAPPPAVYSNGAQPPPYGFVQNDTK